MKKFALGMLAVWMSVLSIGCRQNDTVTVQPRQLPRTVYSGTADTQCAGILQDIWSAYRSEEQFSVYGGSQGKPVEDGPGDVFMEDAAFLTERFFVPRELFYSIAEGATLIHQINPKLFSCAVLELSQTNGEEAVAQVLRGSLRDVQWQGGRPERYFIAIPREGFVLVVLGNRQLLKTFSQYLQQTCAQGRILYDEPICVGIGEKA